VDHVKQDPIFHNAMLKECADNLKEAVGIMGNVGVSKQEIGAILRAAADEVDPPLIIQTFN